MIDGHGGTSLVNPVQFSTIADLLCPKGIGLSIVVSARTTCNRGGQRLFALLCASALHVKLLKHERPYCFSRQEARASAGICMKSRPLIAMP